MSNSSNLSNSPLSIQEIELIEATKLPTLKQQHLRLLAHCLACFKQISKKKSHGPFPKKEEWWDWCMTQPSLNQDRAFVPVLLEQFTIASEILSKIAIDHGITPLELTVSDLITSSMQAEKVDTNSAQEKSG